MSVHDIVESGEEECLLIKQSNNNNDADWTQQQSILLPISEELTRCCICTHDLCSEIYVCGNGLHHFCGTCVERLPCKDHFKNSVYSHCTFSKTQSQDLYDDLYALVESLDTSSGGFVAQHRFKTHIEQTNMRKRKRNYNSSHHDDNDDDMQLENQIQLFGCPFCATNCTFTRLKWLEQMLIPVTTHCKYHNCHERNLKFRISEHELNCVHRPFTCLWCDDQIESFNFNCIKKHMMETHHIHFTSTSEHNKLDLSMLHEEGDQAVYHISYYSKNARQTKEIYVVLRLQSASTSSHKIIGIMGVDLTQRNSDMDHIELVMTLRASNCNKMPHDNNNVITVSTLTTMIQKQRYEIPIQSYIDGMTCNDLVVHCVALLPDSDLFCGDNND